MFYHSARRRLHCLIKSAAAHRWPFDVPPDQRRRQFTDPPCCRHRPLDIKAAAYLPVSNWVWGDDKRVIVAGAVSVQFTCRPSCSPSSVRVRPDQNQQTNEFALLLCESTFRATLPLGNRNYGPLDDLLESAVDQRLSSHTITLL